MKYNVLSICIILITFIFSTNQTFSQSNFTNNYLYFGNKAGIQITNDSIYKVYDCKYSSDSIMYSKLYQNTIINARSFVMESFATIFAYNKFVLYSNGCGVWVKNIINDSTTFVMHTETIECDSFVNTCKQGVMFLPNEEDSTVLMYSLVPIEQYLASFGNIKLMESKLKINNNSIDLIYANKLISTDVSEGLFATRHTNGRDWYVFFGDNNKQNIKYFLNVSSQNINSINLPLAFFNTTLNTGFIKTNLLGNKLIFGNARVGFAIYNTMKKKSIDFQIDTFKNALFVFDASYLSDSLYIQNSGLRYYNNDTFFEIDNSFAQMASSNTFENKLFYTTLGGIGVEINGDTNKIKLDTTQKKLKIYNGIKIDSIEFENGSVNIIPNNPNYALGPDLHPGFTYSQNPNCPQSTITVTDTSWGHFYRVWDWGDGSPLDTFSVTQHADYLPGLVDTHRVKSHTYSQPGTYKVKLYILNPYTPHKLPVGQFLRDSTEMEIVIPDCIFPALSIKDSELCAWDSLLPNQNIFEVKYSGSSNYDTLIWSISPNIAFANLGDSISFFAPKIGTYQVSCKAQNSSFDTLISKIVIANDSCIHPYLLANLDSICPENQKVVIHYLDTIPHVLTWSISPPQSFQDFGDSISFSATRSGNYTISAQVSAYQNSYNQTITQSIHILECPEYFNLYPNPAISTITFDYRQDTDLELVFYNAIGQRVLTGQLLAGEKVVKMDLPLAEGVYFLYVVETSLQHTKKGTKVYKVVVLKE